MVKARLEHSEMPPPSSQAVAEAAADNRAVSQLEGDIAVRTFRWPLIVIPLVQMAQSRAGLRVAGEDFQLCTPQIQPRYSSH